LVKELGLIYEQGQAGGLLEALKNKGVDSPEKTAAKIIAEVEEEIIAKINFLAHLMFYYMELTRDYQGFAWAHINEGFCRIVLKLPLDQEFTPEVVNKYQKEVAEIRKTSGMLEYSSKQIEQLFMSQSFDLLGKAYPTYAEHRINQLLKWLGSNKRLIAGMYNAELGYIFGEVTKKQMEDYEVYVMRSEGARTPNRVLPLVAVISENNIVLRRESFVSFFFDKWVSLFDLNDVTKQKMLQQEKRNIHYMLQKKVLELYGATDKNSLLAQEDKFITEMMQTTLHHEYGHGLLQKELSSPEAFAVGRAATNLGENILSLLSEFLSDFAPKKGKVRGPMEYFINLSSQGKGKQASRMLLMYLADKWFYGKGEQDLRVMSNVFAGVLVPHLKKDGSFDFKSLAVSRGRIYKKLLDKYEVVAAKLKEMLGKADFAVGGQKLDFASLKKALKEMFAQKDGAVDESSQQFKNAFWHQVMLQVINHAPATLREIKDYLEASLRDMVKEITGSSDPEKEITKQLKDLGFYEKAKPLKIKEVVALACEEFNLDPAQVLPKFAEIYEDKNAIDVRGAYKYKSEKSSVFYVFLRKMLAKVDLLSSSNITFGQALEDVKKVTDREKVFREKVESMVNFLNREKPDEISLFAMEPNFLSGNRVEEILKEYTLEDGRPMRELIKQILYHPVFHKYIFEIGIPYKEDALDSRIVQAVFELNLRVRPQETDKLFYLDPPALFALCQKYLST